MINGKQFRCANFQTLPPRIAAMPSGTLGKHLEDERVARYMVVSSDSMCVVPTGFHGVPRSSNWTSAAPKASNHSSTVTRSLLARTLVAVVPRAFAELTTIHASDWVVGKSLRALTKEPSRCARRRVRSRGESVTNRREEISSRRRIRAALALTVRASSAGIRCGGSPVFRGRPARDSIRKPSRSS